MDDSDRASELEEIWRQADLSRRKPEPKFEGHCLNCGLESEGAYCDSECKEDAERIEQARTRNGKQAEEGITHAQIQQVGRVRRSGRIRTLKSW